MGVFDHLIPGESKGGGAFDHLVPARGEKSLGRRALDLATDLVMLPVRPPDSIVRSFAQGASFGLADEIAAGGDATFGPLVDRFRRSGTSQAKTWRERYDENLKRERKTDKQFAD
ncbi:MAG TPA: hypothetical protein VEC14_06145, partial [Reyranellaceae bacterium]|nr:hypothetical protein [Reyranellaceae bacterium]